MEIQGRIKFIGQSEFIGSNGFEKRDLVITTQEQYPQHILIQFSQGNCRLLDNLQIGQLVNVTFNIQGREWTNPQGEVKYFNTLSGWKIQLVQITNIQGNNQVPSNQVPSNQVPSNQVPSNQVPNQQAQQPQQTQQTQMFDSYGQAPAQQQEDDGDLPF